jgi:hypothetical protein
VFWSLYQYVVVANVVKYRPWLISVAGFWTTAIANFRKVAVLWSFSAADFWLFHGLPSVIDNAVCSPAVLHDM